MGFWHELGYGVWHALAFTRIPGNALSFGIRQGLRWSRGRPRLYQEDKQDLFAYLGTGPEAERLVARAGELAERFRMGPLEALSTVSLYRKNLYLLDILEQATEGLPDFPAGEELPGPAGRGAGAAPSAPRPGPGRIKAVDVGSQDWHYVFGLERWLRHRGSPEGRPVSLKGIEIDGHGIYADLHSRRDYARAYAEQTGNPEASYETGDFLRSTERDCDVATIFYPFVTRYALLLWGLPMRCFAPARMIAKAAEVLRPGGWLLVFNHTAEEHGLFLRLGRAEAGLELMREGPAVSRLVDFHELVEDRRFSVWRKRPA
jgi:hypothetical protein